jgi:hypothetical protein
MKKKMWFVILLCIVSQTSLALTWSTFGPEQVIGAGSPPANIRTDGYAVPSFADWNNDGLKDLIVGEGPMFWPPYTGRVRIYLNSGTAEQPVFTTFFYAQSNGEILAVPASDCTGAFSRVVQWDGDGRKDLLIGLSDGTARIYFNTGTDAAPVFDNWQSVEVGPAGSKTPIDVGARAAPMVVDWNNDGKKDLLTGALDGLLRLYINEGTDTAPDFVTVSYVQENGDALLVPTDRSSPEVADFNGDGKKDLLAGNTEGQLLLYLNAGTDAAPAFSGYITVESDGQEIDLPSITPSQWARSRPFVCDWNNDGYWDILVGWGQSGGYASIYLGQVFAGDMEPDGDVDLADFVLFAGWWLSTDCGSQADCGGADILLDGQVLLDDLSELAGNWLLGPRW